MGEGIGGSNVEIAHHPGEHHSSGHSHTHEAIEIAEAIVLAIVAVSTAWSGYQATLWTGRQAELYAIAGRHRVQAEAAQLVANQERLYNASTVVEWLKAAGTGQRKLATLFERRILPEFQPAFEDWKAMDPVNNANAPAGPFLLPSYRSAKADEAVRLDSAASADFDQGNAARAHSDDYVRVTVTLATVLLLLAISQRFKVHAVRLWLGAVAVLLLCAPIYQILTLPRR
jgi:hypothetical protein